MISTVSKESAPKSTNLESAATASRSVPSCSEMMPLTLSRVSPDCASWSGKDKQEMCACGQSNVFTLFYGGLLDESTSQSFLRRKKEIDKTFAFFLESSS